MPLPMLLLYRPPRHQDGSFPASFASRFRERASSSSSAASRSIRSNESSDSAGSFWAALSALSAFIFWRLAFTSLSWYLPRVLCGAGSYLLTGPVRFRPLRRSLPVSRGRLAGAFRIFSACSSLAISA